MAATKLTVSERSAKSDDGLVTVLSLAGSLDASTAPDLEAAFARAVAASGPPRVVVDFAGADFVASAGWGVLLSYVKRVKNQNGNIRVTGMRPSVASSYDLLGLPDFIKAFRSPDEARTTAW